VALPKVCSLTHIAEGSAPTQAPFTGQAVLVRVRQPSAVVAQVQTSLPTQRLPFIPAGQSVLVGSFTHRQSAGEPPHCLAPLQVLSVDEVAQPSALVPQLSTVVVPLQTVPLVTPAQAGSTGPQVQSAEPFEPAQGLPLGQVLSVDEVAQPSALVPQERTLLPLQAVPVTPAQAGAAAAQRQSAAPFITPQGLPAGQVLTVEEVTQPLVVVPQLTTVLLEQTVAVPPPTQAAAGGSQTQAALPALPWQVSLGPQVFMAVMAGQPEALVPQLMRVVPLVQRLPLTPMQAAGAAPQEQEAEGAMPVQGLAAGQVVVGPL